VFSAGAQAPGDFMDGRSLYPLLGSNPLPSSSWRSDFLVEHWTDQEEGLPDWFGVRTKDQIYAEYPMTSEKEFYELGGDPYQLGSKHATAPSSTLTPLASRLTALRSCRAAACR